MNEGPTSVAVVIVTYNRAALLDGCLDGLAAQTVRPDAVYVVDNASIDATRDLLEARSDLPLRVVRSEENIGGAGGFNLGVRLAYEAGFDRIWLMDDDVVPAPDCLAVLVAHPGPALMPVREDRSGALVEKAAMNFDLESRFIIHPKRLTVEHAFATRADLPREVPLQNVAFEGFMVSREVIDVVGLPDPSFFIFYDDVDFALRARAAGFAIVALRDAVMVRQLDFDKQHALDSWKGYYMYRNLFVVHFRYGANLVVRLKPYLIAAAVVALSPRRGGRGEASNVLKAITDAGRMRRIPPGGVNPGAPAR
uniref:Rhamnosyl transferase n=1 Tax=uncultured Nocardioidaceae bacterium TaxID=253824 RepID=A0A6J4LMH5_9ACTN|nr:MAG: Rhamnosyl transferase [uncultured Nocardioidaceae bacterium]